MKILHLSFSDIRGGAHIAGFRLHKAISEYGIQSESLVCFKDTDDPTVTGPLSVFSKNIKYLKK